LNIYLIGSLAFDEIGHYNGRFVELFKEDRLENLSVSFVVEDTMRFFGGCMGNVAYSLGLLHTPAVLCSLLGQDGHFYSEALKSSGMDIKNLKVVPGGSTAHAMIATDLSENQITQFAPGVIGSDAPDFILPQTAKAGDILLVGPENRDRMFSAVKQGAERGMRVFFDPGQLIHTFTPKEILQMLELSEALFVNDYEFNLLLDICDIPQKELFARVPLVFVTHGDKGVNWYEKSVGKFLPAVPAQLVDPTGAGDAFRAGVLAGIKKGLPLENSVQVGAILGAACVEYNKTQGHKITESQIPVLRKLGFEV
jgi:adenosine kinase